MESPKTAKEAVIQTIHLYTEIPKIDWGIFAQTPSLATLKHEVDNETLQFIGYCPLCEYFINKRRDAIRRSNYSVETIDRYSSGYHVACSECPLNTRTLQCDRGQNSPYKVIVDTYREGLPQEDLKAVILHESKRIISTCRRWLKKHREDE